jgi:hypothetical protein
MSILWLIRLFTLLFAISYGVAYAEYAQWEMYPDPTIVRMGHHSPLTPVGIIGLYATAAASLVLAYGAIPRWPAGCRALSWCFLLMWLSLLIRLATYPWRVHSSALVALSVGAWVFVFALPPLVLFAMLRQPFVEQSLRAHSEADQNV